MNIGLRILELLSRNGPMTRGQIAFHACIPAARLVAILDRLCHDGIIEQAEKTQSLFGRKGKTEFSYQREFIVYGITKKGAAMPGGRPRTKTADSIAAQVREIMRRADRNTSAHQEEIDVRQAANEAEIETHAKEHEAMIAQIRAKKQLRGETKPRHRLALKPAASPRRK